MSKTDAARIAKLDTDMTHREFWKVVYFGVKTSKVKITRQRKPCRRGFLHSGERWLLLVYQSVFIHEIISGAQVLPYGCNSLHVRQV